MCVSLYRCMHACVHVVYRADVCILDVWPSVHYGSGPRPCGSVSMCVYVYVHAYLCVWYTELM